MSSKRPVFQRCMKSRRTVSSLYRSPGLVTISALRVSCGTRRAPRNSTVSISCPASAPVSRPAWGLHPAMPGRGPASEERQVAAPAPREPFRTGCEQAAAAPAFAVVAVAGVPAGGVAGGCCCGFAGGGVCCCGVCASTGERPKAQKQAETMTRRARLKNLMQAYLSTLRFYRDIDSQESVSLERTLLTKIAKALF